MTPDQRARMFAEDARQYALDACSAMIRAEAVPAGLVSLASDAGAIREEIIKQLAEVRQEKRNARFYAWVTATFAVIGALGHAGVWTWAAGLF